MKALTLPHKALDVIKEVKSYHRYLFNDCGLDSRHSSEIQDVLEKIYASILEDQSELKKIFSDIQKNAQATTSL